MNAIDITKIIYEDENIAIVYDGEDKLDDYGPASTFYVLPKIDGKIYPISIGMNMFQYDVEDPIKECPIEVIEVDKDTEDGEIKTTYKLAEFNSDGDNTSEEEIIVTHIDEYTTIFHTDYNHFDTATYSCVFNVNPKTEHENRVSYFVDETDIGSDLVRYHEIITNVKPIEPIVK